MITVGLIGGVASGKSLVAECFRDLGACVMDVDRFGHDVLTAEDVIDELAGRWGDRVTTVDGKLDRSAIAGIVFGEAKSAKQELAFLESVTHPRIAGRIQGQLELLQQRGRHRVAILDAAVLLKAGWDQFCQRILFVDAPRELRLRRAVLRGLSEDQFLAREANQISVETKRQRADLVIDNSGPPQKTRQQVEEVWHSLAEIA